MGIPVIPARREIPESREIPGREKFEAMREGGNGNFPLNITDADADGINLQGTSMTISKLLLQCAPALSSLNKPKDCDHCTISRAISTKIDSRNAPPY